MLEISLVAVPKGAQRARRGPSGAARGPRACREGPMVGQNDLLKPKKHCFQYRMLRMTMKASVIWWTHFGLKGP